MKKSFSILFILVFSLSLIFGSMPLKAQAAPALATNSFRGANWAVLGDNFSTSPLVIQGLSSSDSYATVQAKANALYDDMSSTMGINTVRLPINTHTVGTTWWNNYRGAIDAATARGFKVILAYWEDGAASGGRITNTTAWNSMWSTVVSQYGSNSLVYFEPMNEPHGYSSTEWRDLAASWLSAHSTAVKGRVLIGGTGFSQDLRDLCNDTRFSATLFSFHYYAFFYSAMTYDQFLVHIQSLLGSCASRAVMTEYGADMSSGLNYADANSADNFVRYLRAVAQVMRNNQMGGTYWPALGGKITAGTGTPGYDHYSIFAFSGSGTNLNLAIRSQSGADRVRYGWGDTIGSGPTPTPGPTPLPVTYYRLTNRNSSKVADVAGQSTTDGARVKQYPWNGGTNQQWEFQDAGSGYFRIVGRQSGKCLDVVSASTADGAQIEIWACNGGTNQQFQWAATGSYFNIKARHSGKCISVVGSSTADGALLEQRTCGTGNSFQWTRQ
jgi:endoglucanase